MLQPGVWPEVKGLPSRYLIRSLGVRLKSQTPHLTLSE
jgi:hypothetical protein